MNYDYNYYENFDELLEADRQTAKLLLNELELDFDDIEDAEWSDESLCVYPNTVNYAIYELTDGWYCNHDFGRDFNGAPNPLDYIDLDSFGSDLISSGDDGVCRLLSNDKVVTTSYGW